MDDRGRLAQSLRGIARWRSPEPARMSARATGACVRSLASPAMTMRPRSRYAQTLDRWSSLLAGCLPRGAGLIAAAMVIFASLAYGAVKGDHLSAAAATLKDA